MRKALIFALLAFETTGGCAFAPKPLSLGQNARGGNVQCAAFPRTFFGGVVIVCWSSLKIVSQGDVAIVERLGKFHKRLDPGLHVVIPFIDRLRTTISQREQVFDIPPQKCITSDNAPLSADAVVYWRVVDPAKAFYSVMDLKLAIQNLVLT